MYLIINYKSFNSFLRRLVWALSCWALLLPAACQCEQQQIETPAGLLAGEVRDPRFPVPIITAVLDLDCATLDTCPVRTGDCISKEFRVEKDTLYFFTVSYFNGDTLNPSCRSCGSVYLRDSVVMNLVTACPTGGPWVDFAPLQPGRSYRLAVCMQRCPEEESCECGKEARSIAIVSMRRVFPDS